MRLILPAIVMIPLVAEPKWATFYEAPSSIRPVFRYYTYYGCAYLAGYLLYSNLHHLETLKRDWMWYAVISLVAFPGIMIRDCIHPQFIMTTQAGARHFFAHGRSRRPPSLVPPIRPLFFLQSMLLLTARCRFLSPSPCC
ncbi:MAG: hypothetical protein Ct9H300mP1_38400 [Planctomycetaceae bacterium]|nr:MAG: hypothetical protein Ct9H300mP1_38400 [Planctomycetaceae bacterium]